MSSNPFRKKALEATETTRVQSPVKSSLRSNSPLGSDGAPPGRPRIVKKVRVLSPPPLSPESPEWPENLNRGGYPGSVYHGPSGVSWSADESDPRAGSTAPTPPPLTTSAMPAGNAAPPANPFSKTMQGPEESKDMENQRKSEGAALKAGNLARHSLNVDSFKRLLLTGKINDPEPVLATDSPARKNDPTALGDPTADHLDTGETTQRDQEEDASSASETSSADNSDRQVGPVSASSPDEQHFGREKKAAPPPPSSRHGKSLRDDASKLGLPTDINKPLPLSPVRTSADSGAGSPSNRETASKVLDQLPEHESETVVAEPQRDAATHPSSSRKLAPAPPPRRCHARGETKGHLPNVDASRRRGDKVPVGDEMPARSGEPRHTGHAPTPPPPRRPHAAPRQLTPTSSQFTSDHPSSTPHSDLDQLSPLDVSATTAQHEAHPAGSKLASPPPRPPTRNPSVKRTPSVASVEGLGRRVSVEGRAREGPARPPPPPPRQRGSSSGSLDVLPRRASGETASAALAEEQVSPDSGKGDDILAGLDALQREVDALRGQIH